jgi:hypothetical protein
MKTMKKFVLYFAATIVIITGKAQFSENFESATIASLNANCWVIGGVITTTTAGEAINGTSIYTLPPVNPGTKVDLYTPILSFSSTNTTVSFDYRLSEMLNNNATRSLQVSIVNLAGIIVASDTVHMDASTTANIQQYQHIFNPIVSGSYRVAFRMTGAQGNGNVRLIFDNLVVSNSTINAAASCNLAPIVETPLPVKMISFNAMLNNNKVDLKWATASESNSSHFVIEKSTDGTNFNDIGMVFSFGTTTEQKNYQYTDNISTSNSTVIYYRLRQVDIDGKFEYSTTRIIRIGKQTENNITILAYPNPVTTELRVTVPNNWQGKKITYTLVNANGQVAKKSENSNGGQTEIVNVSTLAPGLYIMKATCGNETAQQKIVKQ